MTVIAWILARYRQGVPGMKLNRLITLGAAMAAMVATAGLAQAGDGPERGPHLRDAKPLARTVAVHANNPLLSKGGDPGDDDTAISLDPTLSALCQSYLGLPNPYATTGRNVDQINGDSVVGVGSQTGCNAAQNETTIAVNPRNPSNLVAGTNDYRVFNTREGRNDGSGWAYYTTNGGRTWGDVQLPHLTFQTGATGALSDMDSAGDPVVAYGADGTVYYANIVFSRLNGGGGITVNASTDGGRTWSEPSIVQLDGVDAAGGALATDYFNDKEWITVDPASGAVYVTWTRFGPTGSPIVVSRSTDHGRTWSPFVAVNPDTAFTTGGVTPYSQGSSPQVGNDGTLRIAYESAVCQTLNCDQATDHDAIVVATSHDGGQTFSNQEVAYDYDFPGNADTGRATLTGENFRINSFPQTAIDRSTGTLYVTWADDRNGQYDALGHSLKTNGDAFLVASNDGRHWSSVKTIGTGADEVYPAVAADHGRVAVSFYTRTYDPNGIGLDMAYVSAEDVGDFSHARLHRITTQTENPQIQFVGVGAVSGQILQGVFIGDYTAGAMGRDGVFHPCWTDFRGKPGVNTPNQDAYSQAIAIDD
jgi:hypothetical protein